MNAEEITKVWKVKGTIIDVLGQQLFVIDEGSKDLPVIVILHGYPSSSLDYIHVLPLLTIAYRVIIHDHLGFGYSNKPNNYSYSLIEQAEYALALYKTLGIEKAHLLAHDYGTSVATEILARRLKADLYTQFLSVTLSNGSIHIEFAKLRWIQKLLSDSFWGPLVAKFGNEFIYVQQMKRLWYDTSKVNVEELKALWKMSSENNGREVLPKITQYLHERHKYWFRWIGALKELDLPTHILWAEDDPVAVIKIGETLHGEIPNSNFTRLKKLGHYPMLENPVEWSNEVLRFLGIVN